MAASILIGGATGTNGRAVIDVLTEQGVSVRALVRSKAAATGLAGPYVELCEGDYGNRESLIAALSGVEVAYFISAVHKDYPIWFENFLETCKHSAVKRIVKFSGMGATEGVPSEILRTHARTDQVLKSSGMAYTILRPNSFYQNMFMFEQSIKAQGAIYLNMGDARQSLVDVRDIAQVGAIVLTRDGHENKIYDLSGPEAMTFQEVAAKLSQASGKTIQYVPISNEAVEQGMISTGMPEWDAHLLAEIFSYFASGQAADIHDTIQQVTGKAPRTFDQFANDFAAAFN